MRTTQLRPWQRMPDVACERCDRLAVKRVMVSDLLRLPDSRDGVATVTFTSEPQIEAALACEMHWQELSNEICDKHGGACTEPLRSPWRCWLLNEFWPLRPIGWLDIVIHNWRFERRMRRYP